MPSIRLPNILWICTDQQRWDTISCLGFPGASTPRLDVIASEGAIFRNAYCQSPICTPSRVSFLSGQYPISHQVQRNGNSTFPAHLPLLPRMFRKAGYRTGLIGKLHLSRAQGIVEKRFNDGYDEFYWSQHPKPDWPAGHDYHDWLHSKGVDPHQLYAGQKGAIRTGVPAALSQTTWAGERARDFIKRQPDVPWFLSINLFDPHPPFDAPPEYRRRFDARQMPVAAFRPSDIEHQVKMLTVDQQARKAIDPRHVDEGDLLGKPLEGAETRNHDHDLPPVRFDSQELRAVYVAMIAQIDDMVGSLVDLMDETGQREDTLVLFMSDHGEMLGDHGLLYKGCRFYEGLVHVPLIVSYPRRFARGIIANGLVELVDIAPTILEVAGFAVPAGMQGRSLLGLLEGRAPADQHKAYVLSEYFDALRFPGSVGSRGSMYFDGRFKICVYHDAELGELYDLQNDPQEFVNLWEDPPSQALKFQLLERHFNAMMCISGAGPERTADF